MNLDTYMNFIVLEGYIRVKVNEKLSVVDTRKLQ